MGLNIHRLDIGRMRYLSAGTTSVAGNVGTLTAGIGLRLKVADRDKHSFAKIERITMLEVTADDANIHEYEWSLVENPTVAGTFTYADKDNTIMQTALGGFLEQVTDQIDLDGGHAEGNQSTDETEVDIKGSIIVSGSDEIVLCYRSESLFSLNFKMSISWREIQVRE